MVIQSLNFRSKSREARSRWQTRSPRIEICERRMLLASNGFLQGIVSLSGSSQGLAGASIQLQKLDSPSIPNQTTTTNASGAYLFQNLPSG
ncbi:MAG: carboxypeptidase-like regulatory domain-containing protein, partial [Isosphaeraceae bacterium]